LTPPSPTVGAEDEKGSVTSKRSGDGVEEAKPDTPPDGTAGYVEWQEPHHTVIERQESPGDDVEVEVLNSENRDPHAGTAAKIRHSLGLLDRLKTTAAHLEDNTGGKVEEKLEEIQNHVREALSEHHRSYREQQKARTGSQDDEEGWASDGSHPDQPVASGSASSSNELTRSDSKRRAPKMRGSTSKSQPVGSGVPRKRHRTSVRRSHPAPAHLNLDQASSSFTGPEESEARGRSHGHHLVASPTSIHGSHPSPSPSWRPGTPRSRPNTADRKSPRPDTGDSSHSLQNNRLQYIRALHSSPPTRDSSPTRSIRFVDESPRLPLNHSDESQSHGEDTNDQTRVTFELPKSPTGKNSY